MIVHPELVSRQPPIFLIGFLILEAGFYPGKVRLEIQTKKWGRNVDGFLCSVSFWRSDGRHRKRGLSKCLSTGPWGRPLLLALAGPQPIHASRVLAEYCRSNALGRSCWLSGIPAGIGWPYPGPQPPIKSQPTPKPSPIVHPLATLHGFSVFPGSWANSTGHVECSHIPILLIDRGPGPRPRKYTETIPPEPTYGLIVDGE